MCVARASGSATAELNTWQGEKGSGIEWVKGSGPNSEERGRRVREKVNRKSKRPVHR